VATDGWLRADEEDDTAAVAASSRSRVELRRGPSRILCARSLSPVTLCLCVRVCVYFLAPAESDGAEDPLPRNRGLLALGPTCQRPTGPRAACVWWEEEGTQTRGPSQLGPWAARTAGQANASPAYIHEHPPHPEFARAPCSPLKTLPLPLRAPAAAAPLLRRGFLLYTTGYAPALISSTPAPFLHPYAVACSRGSPSERRRRASRAAARVPVRGVPPCARVHRPPCFYRRYCVRTVGSICWAGLGVFSQLCC